MRTRHRIGTQPTGTVCRGKKSHNGFQQRLSLLCDVCPRARQFVLEARIAGPFSKDVAVDDVLDATVAAITATVEESALKTLPADPPKDICGVPMEMVYAEAGDIDLRCRCC